ncbi:hypothetical protein L7H23_08705 [Sphingopyxis sp. BSN-002]|uniref:hypothetical protein n=1 Tax=Sphingopyxis sp. BSN-002 TaxID=2911495 RepID=UPI001EDB7D14|nr:hypothetical protein [Sphingopyxis sp. BSN-002]UKK86159.1 hypothetical protein L7H23_08705 [Sphingopyxis sp. BSN-002]
MDVRKWVTGCAMAVALTGCWDPAPIAGAGHDDEPLTWTKLKDGSFLARTSLESPEQKYWESVTRCWPVSKGFDCIKAMRIFMDIGDETRITLDFDKELPEDGIPSSQIANNYQCRSLMGVHEEIGTGPLASRNVLLQGPWSKSYVSRFLADNGIQGRWFGCVDVMRAINAGSLETLGTTIVTRRMALGK